MWVGNIASGKHAFHVRFGSDATKGDIALLIERYLTFQKVGVRLVADGKEKAVAYRLVLYA